jgi:hypothetical protein
MNNFENLNRQNPSSTEQQDGLKSVSNPSSYQNEGSNGSQKNIGPKMTNGATSGAAMPGQAQSSGYQYINKQVNNVKLVNNNSLTLNVRNFNNRINNININNIQGDSNDSMGGTTHISSNKVQSSAVSGRNSQVGSAGN